NATKTPALLIRAAFRQRFPQRSSIHEQRAAIPPFVRTLTVAAPASFPASQFALLFRLGLLLGLEVFAGLLIDHLHRHADLYAFDKPQELNLHLVAFLDDVGGLLHATRRQLADVHEAVARAEEIHEGTEVHHLHDRSVVDHPDLRIRGNRLDPVDG